tara:strand:+ start:8378 stop:9250 length:873 start_codon:yes stop_codon:yes gene_type:complete
MSKENKKIVVLGSSGFVGGAICKALKNGGENFVGYSSHEINLLKSEDLIKLNNGLKPTDIVVFVSAIAPCKNRETFDKNIQMMQGFCALEGLKNLAHIVYISSDAVYSDSSKCIDEGASKQPANFHGKMHVAREALITQICIDRSIPLSVLRPTLIYGPGDTHNGYGPNKFSRSIANGEPIELFGFGEEKRDHIFIEDVANLVLACLQKRAVGEFNLATGTLFSFLQIAQMLYRALPNEEEKINFINRIGPMPHNGYRALDNTLARKTFEDFNFTSMEDGLRRTILHSNI